MPPPQRLLRRTAAAVTLLLAALAAVVAIAWATDDVWMKPVLRHYVMSHAGRRFEFQDVHVRLDRHLDPTVDFRGLEIENAPWADRSRPLIRAKRAAATIAWRSLFSAQTVITLFVFEDAQLDLERRADGLRNWRLGHPDDRGPPTLRVRALDVRDSTLHTVDGDADVGAVVDIAVTMLPAPRALPGRPDLPLTRRVEFSGDYQGRPFDGDVAVSELVTLTGTGRRFALDGHGRLDGLRLDAHGVVADAHDLDDVVLDARLASEARGDLWPLPMRASLARLRPLVATAHVEKAGTTWTAGGLHATFGHGGTLDADLRVVGDADAGQRHGIRATVSAATLPLADVRAVATPPGAASGAHGPPADAFALDKLRGADATLVVRHARIVDEPSAPPSPLALEATLADGVLALESFELGFAGGRIDASGKLDASRDVATLALALQARGLALDVLSARLAASRGVAGRLDAKASVQAQGRSLAAFARSAEGRVEAALAPGATVSQRVDAKLGLDGGEWLRSLLGDATVRVPVTCASLALDVAHGVGRVRAFAFETERTALAGRGEVDLGNETLDVTLMPVRKRAAVLTVDRSLHAQGPWRDVKVALAPPVSGLAPQRCPR